MVPLQKTRSAFIQNTYPFTLETIESLPGKPTFLRLNTSDAVVTLPDNIKILKEVTFNNEYSSYEMAKKGGIPDY